MSNLFKKKKQNTQQTVSEQPARQGKFRENKLWPAFQEGSVSDLQLNTSFSTSSLGD